MLNHIDKEPRFNCTNFDEKFIRNLCGCFKSFQFTKITSEKSLIRTANKLNSEKTCMSLITIWHCRFVYNIIQSVQMSTLFTLIAWTESFYWVYCCLTKETRNWRIPLQWRKREERLNAMGFMTNLRLAAHLTHTTAWK